MRAALFPFHLLGLVFVATLGGTPGRAENDGPCTVDGLDRVACMAGRLCTCRFVRASAATGLPEGFRWDCGILRPRCGAEVPATLGAWQGQLPESLSLDQSRTIVNQVTGKGYPAPRH